MSLLPPLISGATASNTRPGDWYGHLIRIGRRHPLRFISERSRLPVLLPVRVADRLVTEFPAAVWQMLAAVGVPPAAERADIPNLTPHALRHTFGTRWLQADGDIYKLSKMFGHSSVAVTESHYAHELKDDLVVPSRQVKLPIAKRPNDDVLSMRPRRQA